MQIFSFEMKPEYLTYMAAGMVLTAVPTIVALLAGVEAPYGRYADKAGKVYGFPVNGRLAWILQELPSFAVPATLAVLNRDSLAMQSPVNKALLGMFLLHYTQRTFIFPLLIRGGKPTPVVVMLMALVFCCYNGFMQGYYLTDVGSYDSSWFSDPRFVAGAGLFFAGMAINIHSDGILRNLRKPGETDYKIPRGGMFEYVSGANFFGEIVEWTGFAIASWSIVGAAFAIFTFSNIAPRAYQHHQWYKSKFGRTYPPSRRAVIPFIW